jgi:SPP1 gp7 family putative phage head morphogenesis protein
MTDAYAIADRFRRQIADREPAAMARLLEAYRPVEQDILARIEAFTLKMEEWQAANPGQPIPPGWLFERRRLSTLKTQINATMAGLTESVGGIVTAEQRAAVRASERQGDALGLNIFKLPNATIQNLVGFTGDGAPLKELLDGLGPQAGEIVGDALKIGVAQGWTPNRIAAHARRQLRGVAANDETPRLARRLATIARTETQRAFAESTRQTYLQNDVTHYRWLSSRQPGRTCAACWALDGKLFESEKPMPKHVNCRCVMVPELNPGVVVSSGETRFQKLTEEQQKQVLGEAKWAAYASGDVPTLEDFIAVDSSPKWGESRREASLKELLGDRANQFYAKGQVRQLTSVRERFEEAIRDREYEVTGVFDLEGRLVFRKKGDPAQVEFSEEERAIMRGGALVHNHPGGPSLSLRDLYFAEALGLTEIKAVTRFRGKAIDFTMRRGFYRNGNPAIWPPFKEMQESMSGLERASAIKWLERFKKGQVDYETADHIAFHEMWTKLQRIADRYFEWGFQYSYRRKP